MKKHFASASPKITKNFPFALVALAVLLVTIAAPFSASAVNMRVVRDVPYVSGPEADPRFHSLDLYLPEGKANFPLLFFVHGGGLTRGDKAYEGAFLNFADFFVREGIGVASPNYRLSPAVQHPAHTQDVAKAFAWVHKHAAEYQIDRSRIFMAGHSAGGYIVSLLGLDWKYLEQEGLSPQALRGVITISGAYERLGTPGPGGAPMPSAMQLVGAEKQVPAWLITFTDRDYYGMAEQGKRMFSLMLHHDLPVEQAVVTDRTHIGQIGGVGRQLPRIIEPGAEPPPRPVLTADTLGPAIFRFMGRVLSNQPLASTLLKPPAPALRIVKDIPYSSNPGADPKFNSLDLYLPEGKTNFPLVFFVHGGGWRAGDKADPNFKSFIETFAKIGIGVASANYRLSPVVKHPAHIEDVSKAFAWLYKNAAQYGIDRNRLFIAGHSAGGHLVALLALDARYLRQQGLSPGVIQGVLALNGIYDVPGFPEIGVIPSRREQSFPNDPKIQEEASPIRYVARQAPPFLIEYAENDLFGIREQAMSFYTALQQQGAKAQLAHIPGRTHFSVLAGMGQQLDQVDDVMAPTAVEFVTRILSGA